MFAVAFASRALHERDRVRLVIARHGADPAILEPVMIMFLGIVIGGIVVSMYLPMFDLINKIA